MGSKKTHSVNSVINMSTSTDNGYMENNFLNKTMSRKIHNYPQNESIYSSPSVVYSSSTIIGRSATSIPTTISNPQYQSNKGLTQELQSRIYYNTSDYHNKNEQHNTNAPSEPYHQSIQSHYIQQPTPIHNSKQQLQHNRNMTCSNGYSMNTDDCRLMKEHNGDTIGTLTLTNPPMVYALHRVVTTAQIQNSVCGTFPSSSKISIGGSFPNHNECFLSSGTSCLNVKKCDHSGIIISSEECESTFPNNKTATKANSSDRNPIDEQNCKVINSCQIINKTVSEENVAPSARSAQRNMQNVIPTCVYLMSRIAVHMEIEGTTECPAQVMLAAALGCEELGIANKLLAQSIFGLWMTSTLLDVQLKPHHKPFSVRVAWSELLDKFSNGNPVEKKFDEPMIMLKRNVFFSKKDEEKIKDNRILELLYEEAKINVLAGRYVMEAVHCLMLGGIQARIELGPYNSHTHTVSFFRENQFRFLPRNVAKRSGWSWLPISRKNSAEVKLLEQFKRVPQTATTRKLMRKYLEFCWALPFYGAAFFQGQVEQPVRGIMSLVNHKDVAVVIAINERGIFLIDLGGSTLLLGLRYEDFSWDFAKPSNCDDDECQTCIFIQFDVVENGMQFSKLIQVFSKQAALMDALISYFTDQMNKRKQDGSASQYPEEPNPIQKSGNGVLCNKLSRLTLATFDEDGRCIGQMGSLTISY